MYIFLFIKGKAAKISTTWPIHWSEERHEK